MCSMIVWIYGEIYHVPGKEKILNDFDYKLQLHIKDTLSFEYMVRGIVFYYLHRNEIVRRCEAPSEAFTRV